MSLDIAATLAGRSYVPPLSYGTMTRAVPRAVPNTISRVGGTENINVFRVTQARPVTATSRANIALRLIHGLNWPLAEAEDRLGVILSCYEIIFPGFVSDLGVPGMTVNYVDITDAMVDYWSLGQINGNPLTSDEAADPPQNVTGNIVPLSFTPLAEGVRLVDAAGVLGLLTYAIVKTPTDLNKRAFTTNRPRGAAAAVGSTADLFQEIAPTQAMYCAAGATLQGYPALRTRLCRTLITWVQSENATWLMYAVTSQVRLWRDHGLHGLKMTRQLLLAVGDQLSTIRGLVPAIEAFNEHWAVYEAAHDNEQRDYENAIMGPLSTLSARRDYSALVIIARTYIRALNGQESMRNFAQARAVAYANQLQATLQNNNAIANFNSA